MFEQIRKIYPHAHAFGCSTAGEICGTRVTDDSLVVTAVHFGHTEIRGVHADLNRTANSYEAGKYLAEMLPGSIPVTGSDEKKKLMHVLVLSDGLKVNGSELVRGLIERLPEGVTATGGLAGDGERFEETLVLGDNGPQTNTIAILGLYGSRLKVGFGSLGGWDSFGPERLVTQSEGNVLYELDGHSALELYKKYLGEHAKGLPVTGLLFPLSLRTKTGETGVVRTILSIDENTSSMTFAGDVPEGSYVRFHESQFRPSHRRCCRSSTDKLRGNRICYPRFGDSYQLCREETCSEAANRRGSRECAGCSRSFCHSNRVLLVWRDFPVRSRYSMRIA